MSSIMPAPFEDRRAHPRLKIPLAARYKVAGDPATHSGQIEDLSAGGALLQTHAELPHHADLRELVFSLTEDGAETEIRIQAEVAWIGRRKSKSGEGLDYLSGLHFVEVPQETFRKIQQFVFRRLKDGGLTANDLQGVQFAKRVPFQQPIVIRFDRFDDFIVEVAANVSSTGMFITTRQPREPGSVFEIEFRLGADFQLITAKTEVVWVRRRGAGPDKPPGMGVRFVEIDPASQGTIEKMVQDRTAAGGKVFDLDDDAPKRPTAQADAPAPEPSPAQPQPVAEAQPVQHAEAQPLQVAESADAELERLRFELDKERREADARLAQLRQELVEAARGRFAREQQIKQLTAELEARQAPEPDRDTELDRLRGELAKLEATRAGLESNLQSSRIDLSAAQSTLQEAQAERERLTKHLEASQEEVGELGRQHERKLQELRDTSQARIDTLESNLVEATAGADRLRREFDQLNEENSGLRSQIDDLTTRHDEAEHNRQTTEDELRGARSRLEALKSDLHNERERALTEIEAKDQRAVELSGILELANSARQDVESHLESTREELRLITASNDESRRQRDELRGERDRQAEQLAELEQQVAQLTGERDSAKGELGQLEAKRAGLEEELASERHSSRRELELLRSERDQKGERLADLESRIGQLAAERDQARGDLEELRTAQKRSIEGLAGERDAQRVELDELRKENERQRESLSGLEAQVSRIDEERERAARALEEIEATRQSAEEELTQERDRLHQELEDERQAKTERESSLHRLEEERQDTLEQLAGAHSRIGVLEGELADARLQQADSSRIEELERELAKSRQESESVGEELSTARSELASTRGELEAMRAEVERLASAPEPVAAVAELGLLDAEPTPEDAGAEPRDETISSEPEPSPEEELPPVLADDVPEVDVEIAPEIAAAGSRRFRPSWAIIALLLVAAGAWFVVRPRPAPDGASGTADPDFARLGGSVATEVSKSADNGDGETVVGSTDAAASESSGPIDAATAPGAAPEPTPPPERPSATEAAIRWALAWSDQRVDDYLASYASTFTPPDGMGRADWENLRRERVLRPSSIAVILEEIQETELGPDRRSVEFRQAYRSDRFTDEVWKTLELDWEGGAWKIRSETVVELPPG